MSQKTYTKNPELIEKENNNKLLLFNVNSGMMFELNETAKLLWNKTGEKFNIDELRKIILDCCYETNNLEQDINELIKIALEKNLIS